MGDDSAALSGIKVASQVDTIELWCWSLPSELQKPNKAYRVVRASSGKGFRIIANQPALATVKSLAALQGKLSGGPKKHWLHVHRVDVGAEYLFGTQREADLHQRWMMRAIHMKWERRDEPATFYDTVYLRRAGAERNLALYSDRPSRTGSNLACSRIELRLRRRAARNAIGKEIGAIPKIDPRDLFKRHLRDVTESRLLDHIPAVLKWP